MGICGSKSTGVLDSEGFEDSAISSKQPAEDSSRGSVIGPKSPSVDTLRAAAEADHFDFHPNTCALEYWEPLAELDQGSISSIYVVRKRPGHVEISYADQDNIMKFAPKDAHTINFDHEEIFVLKSIVKELVRNHEALRELRGEIYTMSHLDHPNIAKVHEAYERHRHVYLIMQFCSGRTLSGRSFSEVQAAIIIRKLLSAVAYMHENNVVHRDIKCENIMFDKPGAEAEVKIIDFGLATRYLSNEYKLMDDRVGTLYSMAPQVMQGVYDSKCDIWSIGVVAYCLLSGEKPFWGPKRRMPWPERKLAMTDRIMRGEFAPMAHGKWKKVSMQAKGFVMQLLRVNPRFRPTAKKALEHAWIKKYRNETVPLDIVEETEVVRTTPPPSDDDEEIGEEILATPENTYVPGGNAKVTGSAKYVYDEVSDSVKRKQPTNHDGEIGKEPLATPENTFVPGGSARVAGTAQFVYDEVSDSVRRSKPSDGNDKVGTEPLATPDNTIVPGGRVNAAGSAEFVYDVDADSVKRNEPAENDGKFSNESGATPDNVAPEGNGSDADTAKHKNDEASDSDQENDVVEGQTEATPDISAPVGIGTVIDIVKSAGDASSDPVESAPPLPRI